ncbi:MAG: NAD(P)/FAD-dependent oxidoreductase [Bacteroidia bacterium]|nr:NAD(P)/FAD-dependent oxidoreductase [Bacteroidia bacterium]MDW8302718.1 NAD(P)/FAD-dependent oxidoreductase [Bacteroidia bacterium]
MRYGIIGGGPAGLYAAYLLTQAGIDCTLFDHQIPYEKPCGGGVTSKAFRQFEILKDLPTFSKIIHDFRFIAPNNREVKVKCQQPLQIVSRKALSIYMLEKCKEVNVKWIPEQVQKIIHTSTSFEVHTHTQHVYRFDFIIGADGAQGISRRFLGAPPFLKNRYSGIGYYIEGLNENEAVIKFYKKRTGYLWVFPRQDHSSVGFFSLAGSFSKELAYNTVKEFLSTYYPSFELNPKKYYSATIPIVWQWHPGHIQGKNWALIGDAGGFTDPITGEGIYYAFKSAEYLAQSIIDNKVEEYYQRCSPIIQELQKSASIFPKFYQTWFTNAMVLMAQKSPFIRKVLTDLILGQQPYTTLKATLKKNIPLVLSEIVGIR